MGGCDGSRRDVRYLFCRVLFVSFFCHLFFPWSMPFCLHACLHACLSHRRPHLESGIDSSTLARWGESSTTVFAVLP